jgi:hypothetical protein
MKRIEEFTLEGKNFVYYDLSDFQVLDEYLQMIQMAKSEIVKYPEQSLLTITNIKRVKFDTSVKNAVAEWMTFNKLYVKCGAMIGVDGIKKIMLNSILTISGRNNVKFVFTKEEAIDWLLKQK